MSVPKWTSLGCQEAGDHGCALSKQVVLQWHPTSGLVEKTAGYYCQRCQRVIDPDELITTHQLARKQQEIKEIQESMGALRPPSKQEPSRA